MLASHLTVKSTKNWGGFSPPSPPIAYTHDKGTESLWKRWLMVSPGSRPKRRAWRRPIDRIVDTASRLQQPSVLTTRGRKETPALLQLERCAAFFLVSATVRAPWEEEEAVMLLFWSGEITVTSIAAGRPPDQNGR